MSMKLINYVNKNYNQEIYYNRTRNRKNLSAWESIRQGSFWSGKCPSGKCPSGKYLSGKCLVGEISVGEVSGRGNVRWGSVRWGCVRRELSGHHLVVTLVQSLRIFYKIRVSEYFQKIRQNCFNNCNPFQTPCKSYRP